MRRSIREGTSETRLTGCAPGHTTGPQLELPRGYTRYVSSLEPTVMKRTLIPLALAALLSGCGLAETASTTATIAESEAEQAKQAQQMKAKIEQDIEATQKAEAERRKAAEAASD